MTENCPYDKRTRQDWINAKKIIPEGSLLACYDNHPVHIHIVYVGMDELQIKENFINEVKRLHPELEIKFYDVKIY